MNATNEPPRPLATLGMDSRGALLNALMLKRACYEALGSGRIDEGLRLRGTLRRKLHEKINAKSPEFLTQGRLCTKEGQLHLVRFIRRIRLGDFISPGDVYLTNPSLRENIVSSVESRHGPPCQRAGECYCLPDRETWFPQWMRDQLAERRAMRALLVKQGASPRRARTAIPREMATCTWCGHTFFITDVGHGCPYCLENFVGGESRSYRVWWCACGPDNRPLGHPKPPEPGDRDYTYEHLPDDRAEGFQEYHALAA